MSRALTRLVVVLLLLAPLGACLPTEGNRYGQLEVTVRDQDGAPVYGATVQPYGGWHWSERRAVGRTDAEGHAAFTLPVTTYHVHAFPPAGYRHADPSFPVTYAVVEVGQQPASVVLTMVRE